MTFLKVTIMVLIFISHSVNAESYTYKQISKRHPQAQLTPKQLDNAKMEGECLVGLKELNFKKKTKFDAVAEWTNYRSISLLEQYSPCTVLVILEVAKSKLDQDGSTK